MLSLASFWFACAHFFPSFVGKTLQFCFFGGATDSSSLGLGRLGLSAHGPRLPSSMLFRPEVFIAFGNVAVCMIAPLLFPSLDFLMCLWTCRPGPCPGPRLVHQPPCPSCSETQCWLFLFVLIFKVFICFRLCWVFLAVHRLALGAASRELLCSSGFALGFSLQWLLLLWTTHFRCAKGQ